MHFDLDGHVAVITGGNGGIGLGMARGLTRADAKVAIWARNEDKSAAACAELAELGGEAAAFVCDVTDEAQIDAAMEATLERFGKVDSCFANAGWAGTGHQAPVVQMERASWERVIDVNLTGTFLTFRAALRHMLARGEGGALVATSSVGALYGIPASAHYAAAKAGLGGLVRTIAVEYGRNGIRANVLLPGWIETEMTEPLRGHEKLVKVTTKRTPARRWGKPEDFEAVAVYLATPHAPFHNGDTIRVDGGYVVQ